MSTPNIEELITRLQSRYSDTKKMLPCDLEHSAASALQSQAERIADLEADRNLEKKMRKDADEYAEELREKYNDTYGALDDAARENTSLRAQLAEIEKQEPVAIALNTGTKQGVKWLRNVPHGEKLFTRPMPAQPADHEARELVSRLTAIAKEFHGAQQLRERIANEIRPFTLVKPAQGVTLSLTDAEIAEVQASDPIYMTCSCMKFAWDILAAANAKGAK